MFAAVFTWSVSSPWSVSRGRVYTLHTKTLKRNGWLTKAHFQQGSLPRQPSLSEGYPNKLRPLSTHHETRSFPPPYKDRT
jgi:hypothetical protein